MVFFKKFDCSASKHWQTKVTQRGNPFDSGLTLGALALAMKRGEKQ